MAAQQSQQRMLARCTYLGSDLLIHYSYLFNPFTIATCIARPTSILTNTFILSAIASAANARSLTFVLALSAASYLSLYPVLLFPPLLILCYDQTTLRSVTLRIDSCWTIPDQDLYRCTDSIFFEMNCRNIDTGFEMLDLLVRHKTDNLPERRKRITQPHLQSHTLQD